VYDGVDGELRGEDTVGLLSDTCEAPMLIAIRSFTILSNEGLFSDLNQ
jgi:hypothetical protein